MKKSKNKTTFAADIDNEILKVFSRQVESRGFLKGRAVEAAIKFWTTLPTEVQSQIIAGEIKTAAGVESTG